MGPDNQNNLQNNGFGSNMPVMGPQPQPTPAPQQQPVMGVPQPLSDTDFQSVQPQPIVQPQPVMPEPIQPEPVMPQPIQPEPVQLQPIAQPQPVTPEPIQPEPMQPEPMQPGLVPGVQPMPGQPMPEQPGVPEGQPMSALKSKKNLIIIGAIAGVVVIAIIIAIIVMLNSGKKPSQPADSIPEPSVGIVPTPELAKSVCEERNGIFKSNEDLDVDLDQSSNKYYSAIYSCEKYSDGQAATLPDDFAYEIYFVKEDLVEDYWSEIKTNFSEEADGTNLASAYTMLENSDEYIKGHVAGEYIAAYEDAMIMVSAGSEKTAEDILVELGFPDRNRADGDKEDEGENENDEDASQRDAQRLDDYSMTLTAMESYAASNDGKIDGLTKKSDPADLDAVKWTNKTGKDPNGNKYEVKAYSYAKWQDNGNIAPAISETTGGAQVFIITKAKCTGADANGNSMPQADTSADSFAIYGYLESGSFLCLDSNTSSTVEATTE